MQVGAIGLIKAIDRFDPDHGVGFTTFALPTILGEVRRHFRDTTWAVHVPAGSRNCASAWPRRRNSCPSSWTGRRPQPSWARV
ncbi:sigma factor [Streptomyces sp. 1331.2]|uniref:sigma factor n=1 Tax=Streptomyces sp. 1331.2 TaxID=1938835 RepID=UPI0026C4F923